MRVRVLVLTAAVAFSAALAVIVGWRLSSEAMAVLVGVAAGVLASIPTSLLIVWLALRRWRAAEERASAESARDMWHERAQLQEPRLPVTPPVVVLAPGAAGTWGAATGAYGPAALPAMPAPRREFTVIGDG